MSDQQPPYPPEQWMIDVPFDSAEWGLRPPPTYEDESELGDGTDPGDDDVTDDTELSSG